MSACARFAQVFRFGWRLELGRWVVPRAMAARGLLAAAFGLFTGSYRSVGAVFVWFAIASIVLLSPSGANAAEHILATDDVRACAFGPEGSVLGATAGGLVVAERAGGVRVLTALDGLPDTRLERLTVSGELVRVDSRAGSAEVALAPLRIIRVVRTPSPGLAAPVFAAAPTILPSGAELRMSLQQGDRRCLATSAGLLVSERGSEPHRVLSPSLVTDNIAALAAGGGRLFVGSFDRGIFVITPDGRVKKFNHVALNPNVNALAWDQRGGVLWVGTARGLMRCTSFEPPGCGRHGDGGAIHALSVLGDGRVVAGGDTGLLFFDALGSSLGGLDTKRGAPFRSVWALAEVDGELFVGTTNGLFWGRVDSFRANAVPGRLRGIRRLARVSGELPDDWVTALVADGERLYVGTYSAGLATFSLTGGQPRSVGRDPTAGYVNPGGVLALGGGKLAVSTMEGLLVGIPGALGRVRTLGRDVTGVVSWDRGHFVATRRGVQWWAGE